MQDFEKSYDNLAEAAKDIFNRNARKMRGKIEEEEHQTISVVAPNSQAYEVDGIDNADLNLVRGGKYVFEVDATGHPFYIKTDKTGGEGDQYTDGVTNNGLEKGTLEFEVPADAPDTLYYVCAYHPVMVGTLNITDTAEIEEGTEFVKGDVVMDVRTKLKGTVLHKGNKDDVFVKFGSITKGISGKNLRLVESIELEEAVKLQSGFGFRGTVDIGGIDYKTQLDRVVKLIKKTRILRSDKDITEFLESGMGRELGEIIVGQHSRLSPSARKNDAPLVLFLKKQLPIWDSLGEDTDLEEGTGKYKGETWEQGFERRVIKTTKPEHIEKGFKWRIKGKERDEISIKLYKNKPDFKEFTKQMKRVAGHEFGG